MTLRKHIVRLGVWIFINIIIGSILTIAFANCTACITIRLFFRTQLLVFILSAVCYFPCYFIGSKLLPYSLVIIIPIMIVVANLCVLVGIYVEHGVSLLIYGYYLEYGLYSKIVIILFVSAITGITVIVEKFRYLSSIDSRPKIANETRDNIIQLKEGGKIFYLKRSEIIYLRSFGRKTILYTESKSYELHKSFKAMTEVLSANHFYRIHKQYIINREYIDKIEHYKHGKYFVYLKDDEQNILPLSRNYVHLLKEQLATHAD